MRSNVKMKHKREEKKVNVVIDGEEYIKKSKSILKPKKDFQESASNCGCGGTSKVIDSRYNEMFGVIRRRRKRLSCGKRWSTFEVRINEVEEDEVTD